MEEVGLDRKESLVAGLLQEPGQCQIVDEPVPHGRRRKEEPVVDAGLGIHLQILDVGGENPRGELPHALHGVVEEPGEVGRVEIHAEMIRVDLVEQLHDLVAGEIDVVLDRQLHTMVGGDADGLAKHPGEPLDLLLMVLEPEHQARAHHPHHVGPEPPRVGDHLDHLLVGRLALASLEPVGMAPGEDPHQASRIELRLETIEIRRLEPRKKAALERHAIDAELLRAVHEPLDRDPPARILLLGVDLAEEPVVAVVVDANFHRAGRHGFASVGDGAEESRREMSRSGMTTRGTEQ